LIHVKIDYTRRNQLVTFIDGKALAQKTKETLKIRVQTLKEKGITPGLAVILVGENPASQAYVRGKESDAKSLGFISIIDRVDESISQEELLKKVEQYNQDKNIHGLLVQLPLPKHINEKSITLAIDPKKDVDGFHPVNMGHLFLGNPLMIPCTPFGIMRMFEEYAIDLEGKEAIVIGRSNIVGKPMATLLTMANATVTIAHSRTTDLPSITKRADILVVTIGQSEKITKEYVKNGAVVIDVGMNRSESGKLVGDVKTCDVAEIASFLTPVPGGVGPMTRAMLMEQTVLAAERSTGENLV
jgi:methylenetetrahydrofolate dehydrogenase (NADP+)/methenyltetrahydrofolate cyclohydrolase